MLKEYESYMIIGAGRSGIASARFLCKKSSVKSVILTDVKTYEQLEKENFGIDDLPNDKKLKTIFGAQPSKEDILGIECVILSPGVPDTIAPVVYAAENGIKVVSEIEFANFYYRGRIIGITGTNGKTTTTTLTAALLKNAGITSAAGGNIGDAFINYAESFADDSVMALELSSFQLSMTEQLHPNVAVITNLTPDHLDRHKTFENYINAKANIFKNMDENDLLILNADDENVRALAKRTHSKVKYFTITEDASKDAYLLGGDDIMIKTPNGDELIAKLSSLNLLGAHNAANVMCAVLACIALDVDIDCIKNTLESFMPVEHRIEYVDTKNGVKYINDSKGTNPEATITALNAISAPIVLILGGYDKHSDFTELFSYVVKKVRYAVILGQTKEKLVESAKKAGFENYITVDTFEEAVMKCSEAALPGDYVLLSPACASWGMFEDYEQRGRIFKQLVKQL